MKTEGLKHLWIDYRDYDGTVIKTWQLYQRDAVPLAPNPPRPGDDPQAAHLLPAVDPMTKRRREQARGLGAQLLKTAILMGLIVLAYVAFLLLGGPQLLAEWFVQFYRPGPG